MRCYRTMASPPAIMKPALSVYVLTMLIWLFKDKSRTWTFMGNATLSQVWARGALHLVKTLLLLPVEPKRTLLIQAACEKREFPNQFQTTTPHRQGTVCNLFFRILGVSQNEGCRFEGRRDKAL